MITELRSFNPTNKKSIAKAIEVLFRHSDSFATYIRDMTVKRLLWAATEHDDEGVYRKYDGQPLWSQGAIQQRINNIKSNKPVNSDLRHEHCVPRKIILERIYSLKEKNENEIFSILDNFCHAVVVSKSEDKSLNEYRSKMPVELTNDKSIENIFARYLAKNIDVIDVAGLNLTDIYSIQIKEFTK